MSNLVIGCYEDLITQLLNDLIKVLRRCIQLWTKKNAMVVETALRSAPVRSIKLKRINQKQSILKIVSNAGPA